MLLYGIRISDLKNDIFSQFFYPPLAEGGAKFLIIFISYASRKI
jgi:hypothetical protein